MQQILHLLHCDPVMQTSLVELLVVEAAFGAKLEELFDEFDVEPLASGSF